VQQNPYTMHLDEAQNEAKRQVDFARRKKEGQDLFERAMRAQKSGELKKALAEYQHFLRGNYPDLKPRESEAQRNVASIKRNLAEQFSRSLSLCQSALDKGDARNAVLACDRVLRENPDETRARELREKAASQLRREMKSIYEDSVLEESLGNIESAKEKWSKIVEKSIPDDEYYKKAKSKLRKYGIGM
jgi:tetratricopeptide (TPR) repeat protein